MKTKRKYRIRLFCKKTNESSQFEILATSMYDAYTTADIYVEIIKERCNKKVEITNINRI